MFKRLFSYFLILLHTLANARVFVPCEEVGATGSAIPAPSHVVPAQAGIQEIPGQELLLEPQVTFNPVQDTHEHRDKSTFGLTPGFGAVLGLAVTLATGTPLGNLASNLTGVTQGFAYAATKAGMQAVASATVVGTANHQGNLGKALEDLGKPASLRNLATSMATAGLIEGASLEFNLPNTPKTFGEHFQKAAIKGAISVPVQATLGGIEPGQAFGEAALSVAANTLGGYAATQIGKAYGAEILSYAEHKLAHAAVGVVAGEILDPKNPGNGALSGAIGAVTSEMLAEAISGNPKEMATQVLGEVAERAALEGRKFSQKEYETALKEAAEIAKNFGQLGGASVALLSQKDVETAIHTAQTATENNLIPGLIAGGLIIWSAYDLWETYANEGPEAALEQAGAEVVVAVVGGTAIKRGFKIAGKIYPIAEAAWAAHVAENPIMAKIGEVIKGAVERGKSWIGGGTSEKILALPEPKFIKHHIFNKFRGTSQQSEKYRQFFKKHDIQVDSYTVEIPEGMHRFEIHVAENNWTTKWKQWIDQNPNATTKEVYQFAGQMMDNYKLNNLPLVPYKGK